MHTLNLFIQLVQEHRFLGYTVLFFAMIFEGELFLAATGMLVGLRAFDPGDAFLFAFAGVLAGDLLWYWLGHYLQTHHSHRKFVDATIKKVHSILPGLEKNPAHVIFLSKFIYGLNHSTILVLGYLKINFKEFFKVQFLTSLTWSLLFLILGYLFGAAAITYAHSFNRFLLIIFVSILALVLLERVIRRYIEKKEHEK
jgi:membrane protein DedA with SNARE-associated domain